MKPFLSICVALREWDDETEIAQDCRRLRLDMARPTGVEDSNDPDEDDRFGARCETAERAAMKVCEAVAWMNSTLSPGGRRGSLYLTECVASGLFGAGSLSLEDFLLGEAESGDANFGDMIRRIAKKCEELGI